MRSRSVALGGCLALAALGACDRGEATPGSTGGQGGTTESRGGSGGRGGKAAAGGVDASAPAMGGGTAGGPAVGGVDAGTPAGGGGTGAGGSPAADVVRRGLVAQYDFRDSDRAKVRDTSGKGEPLDLDVFVPAHVMRIPHGVRFTAAPTKGENAEADHTTPIIRSRGAATKLDRAVRRSNAVSLEVWFKPAMAAQSGPARMVSLGYTNYERTNLNVLHGPAGCGDGSVGQFIQLRAGGEGNACPALAVPSKPNVTGKLQHLIFTQDATKWTLYLDGAVSASGTLARTPADWNDEAGLAFGNQPYLPVAGAAHGNFRFWQGDLYYAAFYDVALSAEEVGRHAAIPYEQR